MTTSPKLGLAYIVASQAQKEVTHNEALNDLDTLCQLSVKDRHLTTSPASPEEGDAYIVPSGATGDWSGHEGAIACYYSGWVFKTPKAGFIAFVQDEAKFVAFNGTSWALLGGFV
ncbi:MAG: DUF2793 domain-containing protein [Proteobacteria bacterium]|jgi:hypothetical protein|nr:DUF2793 domain-containing protein [Alphaproteobacteria bacterium]NCC03349.1 DUF2793 domain-containing protein [Pseudomonadota bacterium]